MNWPLEDCWYHQTINPGEEFTSQPLNDNQQSGVTIVGAGFAGLATAMGLVERGYKDIVVLESETVGYGASGRNGGFIMAGYSLPEVSLLRRLGEIAARDLYQLTVAAQSKIKQRIREYGIDCELVDAGIVLADWFKHEPALLKQQALMNNRLGANWEYLSTDQLRKYVDSPRYGGGLLEPDGAHFHPLKYLYGLAKRLTAAGVRIHQHCRVETIRQSPEGWVLQVTGGQNVLSEQVVIAAGGYIKGLQIAAAKAVLPIATYVMATEPLDGRLAEYLPGRAAVYDTRFAFDYYRPTMNDCLLWGGRIAIRKPSAEAIIQLLKGDLKRVFPELSDVRVAAAWGGLMGYTRPQMPSISQFRPGLWHALGFGGHGVCATTVVGELLAAALTSEHHRYRLFEPFGLPNAYGWLGMLAAQNYYWWRQLRDGLRM